MENTGLGTVTLTNSVIGPIFAQKNGGFGYQANSIGKLTVSDSEFDTQVA